MLTQNVSGQEISNILYNLELENEFPNIDELEENDFPIYDDDLLPSESYFMYS